MWPLGEKDPSTAVQPVKYPVFITHPWFSLTLTSLHPGRRLRPPPAHFLSKLSASSRMRQGLCGEAKRARPPLALVKDGTRPCRRGRKKGLMGGQNVSGVMLMSLQLHDCPLRPSAAPSAIDQGRVSRSVAVLPGTTE